MGDTSEGASDEPVCAEIMTLLSDLAEVIDILHTEISDMKKILKKIKKDIEDIKGANHTKSESYMHG